MTIPSGILDVIGLSKEDRFYTTAYKRLESNTTYLSLNPQAIAVFFVPGCLEYANTNYLSLNPLN